jgi:hypothetical protein
MKRWLAVLGVGLTAVLAARAQAVTYSFFCISNNLAGDCAIGEAQMTVDVTDPGGGQVDFTFSNSGPAASSITDVYWDDGALLGIATLTNGAGVDFSMGCSPGDLPAGNTVNFTTTVGFCADSDPPTQPNGVNPGETLIVTFNIQGGMTFADVLADLADGTLRVGIHVQGYATGGSESLVNVPEPGTLALLGLGFLGMATLRRRAA